MQSDFRLVGLSHKETPLEIREKLSLNEEESRSFLRLLNETLGVAESLVLSTCNRTEIYYSSKDNISEDIVKLLSIHKSFDHKVFGKYFKDFESKEAAYQLFKVSLGLDSKVLGDIQISNQVKRAYQWSADEEMAGPFLHRLLHSIFYANKKVVQETSFRDGAASTAYAAVDLAKNFILNFTEPKILVLGLGEIGSNIAENLRDIQAKVTLSNRTFSKAEEVAKSLNFDCRDLEDTLNNLEEYDVIISSVVTDDPVINYSNFSKHPLKGKLLIDLSLPRSIEPGLEEDHNILLYNIDQIVEKTSKALKKREKAIPHVESILEEALSDFENWANEMEVSPTIQKLKGALEEIRQNELSKYLKKANSSEVKLLDEATKGIIQKVLKLPVLQLKAACKRGEAETLVEVLNDLFNLEEKETSK